MSGLSGAGFFFSGGTTEAETADYVAFYPLTGTVEDVTTNYDGTETGTFVHLNDATRGAVVDFIGANKVTTPIIPLSNTYSFSFWYNPDVVNVGQELMGYRVDSGNFNYKYVRLEATGKATFQLKTSQQHVTLTSTTTFVIGTWYHITCTYNGANARLYINKTVEDSAACTISNYEDTVLTLGHSGFAYANGQMSNARVYDRGITQTEIDDIYDEETANNYILYDDDLIAYYPFDRNGMDNYYNQYDITKEGNVTFDGSSAVLAGATVPNFDYLPFSQSTHSSISGSLTMCGWFKFDDFDGNVEALLYDWGASGFNTYFYVDATYFWIRNGDGGSNADSYYTFTHGLSTATWYHLGIIRNGFTTYIYVNGALHSTQVFSTYSGGQTTNTGFDYCVGYKLDGNCSDYRVYDVAKDTTYINNIYNAEKSKYGY